MDLSIETLLRALADQTRLRSLLLLRHEGELCVCELTYALGLSQPKISRHLAQLREAGVVVDRREGLWVHYKLNPELPAWAVDVLDATARGAEHQPPFAEDQGELNRMPNRPGDRCCG